MTRDEIIQWIIANDEGGLVTLAGDPGGTTNKGISQRFLDAVRGQHPELALPAGVADLSDAQIASLYVVGFWTLIAGDSLPAPLALVVMDAAVNEGPGTAVMALQAALGVPADGIMGPRSIAACQGSGDALLTEFAARRGFAYAKLYATEPQFELGWYRRLFRVYTAALSP